MAKKTKKVTKLVERPDRDPDHYSKRDVPYWWSPEWTRGTTADIRDIEDDEGDGDDLVFLTTGEKVIPASVYGKIKAIKEKGTVNLYMRSKAGNCSYIQGSIQDEFKRWHEDRQIDYILLGEDPDTLLEDD